MAKSVSSNDPNYGKQQVKVTRPARPDAKDVRPPSLSNPNATGGRSPQTGGGDPPVRPGYEPDDEGRRGWVDKFGNRRSSREAIPSYMEAQAQKQRWSPSGSPQIYKRLRYQQPVIDDNVVVVSPPPYSAEEVANADPAIVQRFKDMLWSKYQQLPASERNSTFWKQVRANPEGAAASLVQRLHANAQVFQRGNLPKLDEAMKAHIQQNDIYQLLSFIDYADKNF